MKFTDFFAEEKYFFISSKEYNLRSRCNIFLKKEEEEDINVNDVIFCLNTHQICILSK